MVRQLLWKEWHEQRWKLIFGTVMLVFFTGTLWAARVTTDHEVYIVIWLMGGMVLSLYSAMGVFAPEISDGTRIFLITKPIRPWKIFTAKWLMGWLNFAVPLLVCSAAVAMTAFFRPENQWNELKYVAGGTVAGIGLGTMFYTMTCCLAPRKSGEAMVGVTGLLLFLGFVFHLFIVDSMTTATRDMIVFQIIPDKVLEYPNPLMWVEFIDQPFHKWYLWLLVLEQSMLFGLTVMVGYRKWKRS